MTAAIRTTTIKPQQNRKCLFALLLSLFSFIAQTEEQHSHPPLISIVIDDIGDKLHAGKAVISLKGDIVCSIFPQDKYSQQLAKLAQKSGKEIILHLPMESEARLRLNAGGLYLDMTKEQFTQTVNEDIDLLPQISGINNHMGSLLTRHPGHMQWLMEIIATHDGLYFLDSRTTPLTVAEQIAIENHIANTRRDVFLDHDVNDKAIRYQFARLIRLAKKNGHAVAIGHPHKQTIQVLKEELSRLDSYGVRLVKLSALIKAIGSESDEK
ncbi:MAG: divergent polysaccharide deacetylase family protein [Gammaproteobacteria bacterium]|nr:MAG: divergent polysaccharide deacetylase family protein [Gammaproteobacteria bacterium]